MPSRAAQSSPASIDTSRPYRGWSGCCPRTVDAFDFDPIRKKYRARFLALCDLAFLERAVCPVFIGEPGTGKTFLARSLAYRACQATKSVLVIGAAGMLNDHSGAEMHGQLIRALRKYTRPALLVIDDFAVLAVNTLRLASPFR
jgi:DNA replication protein DnaC